MESSKIKPLHIFFKFYALLLTLFKIGDGGSGRVVGAKKTAIYPITSLNIETNPHTFRLS